MPQAGSVEPTPAAGSSPPPVPPAGPDTPAPQAPPGSVDQIAAFMQALQQRQIPPIPGSASTTIPGAMPQTDALGLIRTILTNPYLQQALQPAGAAGGAPARAVQLPVPSQAAPGGQRSVTIPLGAVLRALIAASGEALTELYEQSGEDEAELPEYLVGEDGDFLVDPVSDDDRAALVAHLFRLNDAARQAEEASRSAWNEDDAGMDESDAFALAAGFP